jgi:hypothetical protein
VILLELSLVFCKMWGLPKGVLKWKVFLALRDEKLVLL